MAIHIHTFEGKWKWSLTDVSCDPISTECLCQSKHCSRLQGCWIINNSLYQESILVFMCRFDPVVSNKRTHAKIFIKSSSLFLSKNLFFRLLPNGRNSIGWFLWEFFIFSRLGKDWFVCKSHQWRGKFAFTVAALQKESFDSHRFPVSLWINKSMRIILACECKSCIHYLQIIIFWFWVSQKQQAKLEIEFIHPWW